MNTKKKSIAFYIPAVTHLEIYRKQDFFHESNETFEKKLLNYIKK